MIVTTTGTLSGYVVDEVLGIVTGHVALSTNFLKDIKGQFTDFFGGRSTTYENAIGKGEQSAVKIMIERAAMAEANGIIGVSFDYEIMTIKGQILLVLCCGTAVKLRKVDGSDVDPPRVAAARKVLMETSDASGDSSPTSDRYSRDVDAEIRQNSNG